MNKNILITSASRKVNLVQSFKSALRQTSGGKVIAVDINPMSPALYFSDEYHLVPRSDSPEFTEKMLQLCKTKNIKCIIPTRDEELLYFAENKELYKNIGTEVMVCNPDTVKICQNKKQFNEFCNTYNIPIPNTITYQQDIKFPVFVKPRIGSGSIHTFKVDSSDELDIIIQKHPDSIIQEFVDFPEYTVDLFTDFDSNVISVVPRERITTLGGESFVTKTFKNDKIIRESIKLSNKLKLIGHNTIQCFYKDDIIKFIEVNPRYGGAANASFGAGAFTPKYLVDLLSGKTLEPRIGKFKNNFTMLRYTHDIFPDELKMDLSSSNDGNNTIAIDFDGVIHKYSKGWYDGSIYDAPVKGSIESILKLGKKYTIVIFTARSNIQEIRYWINEYIWKFKPPLFNIKITNIKPSAIVYIDDKALKFNNWNQVLKELNNIGD